MTKPELLISAGSIEEVIEYAKAGADAVIVGDRRFALRMPGQLTDEQVGELIRVAHEQGIRAYVSVHNVMSNDQLNDLTQYLHRLAEWKADAISFGDPAVWMICQEEKLELPLHWNAEMTVTNVNTMNYWFEKGVKRAVLARELNLQEIQDIKANTKMEVEVQIHGMTNIYHSKRHLVTSYMQHLNRDPNNESYGPEQGLYLVEHERRNLKLPIYEDENGTHIMSADDICMLEVLDELLPTGVDSYKIEGLLKSLEYNRVVVQVYRDAIDRWSQDPDAYSFDPEGLERIEQLQQPDRELTYGFLYKEQMY